MLTAYTVQQWKFTVENKAFDLNAYGILTGEEKKPGSNADDKVKSDYASRRSKLIGYVRSTLDHSQLETVLSGIQVTDIAAIWEKLLETYQPKTSGSRISVLQEMMALRMRSSGFEKETYSDFGSRCMAHASRLTALLPQGAEYLPETTQTVTISSQTTSDGATTTIQSTSRGAHELLTPSAFEEGYTAAHLARDLAISMIPIGLGKDDTILRNTLNHISTGDDNPLEVLDHLRKADSLARNTQLAEGTSAALQVATAAPKKKAKYRCKVHGWQNTHEDKDCRVQNSQKAKIAETPTTAATAEENVMMATVAHIASPLIRRARNNPTNTSWNPDSGATSHMTPNRKWIRNMVAVKIAVSLANNEIVWATGKGEVRFTPRIYGKVGQTVIFNDVLYVPALRNNLFSILSVVKKSKMRVVIEGDSLDFFKNGELLLTATIDGTVGSLNGTTLENTETEAAYISKIEKELLHQRLGHIGKDRLETLMRQDLATGILVKEGTELNDTCEHCIAGKQHRDPFPKLSANRSTELLGRIHSDLHGPLAVQTPIGYRYWITFIDDHSRFKEVALLKHKSDAFQAFKDFVAKSERKLGTKVKELRDDKGGEYMGNDFIQWCKGLGIARQHTVKATPQQNGVSERLNRTLTEGVIAMLNQARLPMMFWGAAVLYYTDILNATPSSTLSNTTSYEVWHKAKPDLSMHRVFGCRVYVHVLRKDRKNLQSHTEPCVFIGFEPGYKGWKCYNPVTKKITISRDVIFAESTFPGLSTVGNEQAYTPIGIRDIWPDANLEPENPPLAPPHAPIAPPPPPHDHPDDGSDESDNDDDGDQAAPRTPERPPKTEPKTPATQQPSVHPSIPPTPTKRDPSSTPSTKQLLPIPALFPGLPAPAEDGPMFPELPPPAPVAPPAPAQKRTRPPPPPPRESIPRKAKVPKAPPLVAQSSRPVRKTATTVKDYQLASGKGRRGTIPVARREGGEQVADRGGAQRNNQLPETEDEDEDEDDDEDDEPVQPIAAEDFDLDDEPVDMEDALRATSILDSLISLYHVPLEETLTLDQGMEMAFYMAQDKALGAATRRPGDAPRTHWEAFAGPDGEHWQTAAQVEIDALTTNGTWELVELPEGRKVVGSRWVFLIKRKADGTIDRYKARLVAKGYSQMPGVDYDQTWAPASRLTSIRAIFAQAAMEGHFIETIDVDNAYLNGTIEEQYEVYMEQAPGFEIKNPDSKGRRWVCRLKKGLYGLKQSGRLWYQKLASELEAIGFTQIKSDPAIYVWEMDGTRIVVPVFVDDITITSKSQEKIQWLKDSLAKVFKIKDLGPTSYLLGIKVDYDRENRVMRLSQTQYILDMLARFKMEDCYPVGTPMDPGSGATLTKYIPNKADDEMMKNVPYMNAIGALIYLMIATRPDIAYAVAKLAQYNSNPGPMHWKAVKHLFRYLKGTKDLKLTYRNNGSKMSSELFQAYSDADHAGCLDTRRSTSGFVIKMGSGAVSWSAKKQSTVADSSTEAEYVSASSAGRDIIWMRTLLKELGHDVSTPSPLMVDNQSALKVLRNPELHSRMKHIDIKMHWIRDAIKRGDITVHFLSTTDMIADIFTKPLPKPAVERHRLALGLE